MDWDIRQKLLDKAYAANEDAILYITQVIAASDEDQNMLDFLTQRLKYKMQTKQLFEELQLNVEMRQEEKCNELIKKIDKVSKLEIKAVKLMRELLEMQEDLTKA